MADQPTPELPYEPPAVEDLESEDPLATAPGVLIS